MMEETAIYFMNDKNRTSVTKEVSSSLNKGNICIIPTDTIYGIVAIDCFTDSVNKIYEIKKRPAKKPFIRLIGSMENIPRYTGQTFPEPLKKYWPGPLTILFQSIHGGKVSIRYPDDPFLDGLFRMLGYKALVAPSANISGGNNIYENEVLVRTFRGKVSIIVCLEGGQKKRRASTIIDISTGPWKLIREGDLKIDLSATQTHSEE